MISPTSQFIRRQLQTSGFDSSGLGVDQALILVACHVCPHDRMLNILLQGLLSKQAPPTPTTWTLHDPLEMVGIGHCPKARGHDQHFV